LALAGVTPSYNRALGILRLLAMYALLAAIVAPARPTPTDMLIGIPLVGLGQAIRVWSAGFLSKNVELVTSGPYRYVRNPLYLGRLLILTGLCVMCRLPGGLNWIVLAVGLGVFFGYYMPRKERVEPARLESLHGDAFVRYRRAVPSLIPRLRPWVDGSSAPWSARRMLQNREHWMVVGLAGVTGFLLWRALDPIG